MDVEHLYFSPLTVIALTGRLEVMAHRVKWPAALGTGCTCAREALKGSMRCLFAPDAVLNALGSADLERLSASKAGELVLVGQRRCVDSPNGGGHSVFRGLTFELTRRRRRNAWPARQMICRAATRARRYAVGCRVERMVRPHSTNVGPSTSRRKRFLPNGFRALAAALQEKRSTSSLVNAEQSAGKITDESRSDTSANRLFDASSF